MTIKIKPSKVGSLHTHLGVPQDKKIPRSKLSIKSTDSESIRKKKQFAINARSFHHADGGMLYEDGGILYRNGGDTSLMEDYINPTSTAGILAKTALQIADPTGISSYPDVYAAGRDMYNNPSWKNAGSLGWQTLGALPMMGKVTAAEKIAKGAAKIAEAEKGLKAVSNLNKKIDTIGELIPGVKKLTGKVQDITTKYVAQPLYDAGKNSAGKLVKSERLHKYNKSADILNWTNTTQDFSGLSTLSNKKSDGGNLFFLGGIKPPNAGVQGAGSIAGSIGGMIPKNTAGGGAASGALEGASMGMTLGPIGGLVGAGIGGAVGFFGGKKAAEQERTDEFNSSMQERNNLLGIKANGGRLYPTGGDITTSGKVRDFLHKTVGVPLAANQFGYDILGGQSPLTENSLSKPELDSLRGIVRKNLVSGSKTISYEDYDNTHKTNISGSDLWKYRNDPSQNLKYTLGQARIDIANGDTTVVDKYNFDDRIPESERSMSNYIDRVKSNGMNLYGQARNVGSFLGSDEKHGSPVNIKINQKANGGQLTEFGAGGSHETNPQQGVQQGIAEDGTPNRVEQGETKWQDYIFSDRLLIDKQAVQDHNLPKTMEGKSFADMSKRMSKLHKERPNDPITRDTMKDQMGKLMAANDDVRQYQEGGMMAGGGRLYDGGSELDLLMNKGVTKQNFSDIANKEIRSEVQPDIVYPDQPLSFNDKQQMFGNEKTGVLSQNSEVSSNNSPSFFKDPKNLRYAPIAFDALAATGLFGKAPKPTTYNPTTIQQPGTLQAPQVDEQTMRANIDSAYQNQIRGMSDATGGSGAALRAGLTGVGADYMSAVGQGFLGANTANNQARQQADQYNLGTQANVASQNAQMQNQAGMYNNQLQNQNNALNYDQRMSYLGKGAEGLGDVGYEARNADIMKKIYGYDINGNYRPLNPSERSTAKACGGRLRMMRRKK